jgi:hypothetical protein
MRVISVSHRIIYPDSIRSQQKSSRSFFFTAWASAAGATTVLAVRSDPIYRVLNGPINRATTNEAEGARELLFRLGRQKFGKVPAKGIEKKLNAISDLGQLENLADRLLDVASWKDPINGH